MYGGAVYGQGSGPIWLDDVDCVGTEARIQDCQHATWGTHNCEHTEDASINCLPSRGGISFHIFFSNSQYIIMMYNNAILFQLKRDSVIAFEFI